MQFPENLSKGYQSLSGCQLIRTRVADEKSLAEFQRVLNASQPEEKEPADQVMLETVRLLYTANPHKFLAYVAGTTAECSVLWTEAKAIVRHLNLGGLLYLAYDKETGVYSAQPHEKREHLPREHVPRVREPIRHAAPARTRHPRLQPKLTQSVTRTGTAVDELSFE